MTAPEETADDIDVPEQLRIRREKRDRVIARGDDPYPVELAVTHTLAQVREQFADLEQGASTGTVVSVAGRVIFQRDAGKLLFATLQAGEGSRLQAMISVHGVGEAALAEWKADVDLGDIVSVTGEVISSKRGELSVLAQGWQFASKALRPLPVAHKELSEETRVRQRYLDLIVRPEARAMATARVAVLRELRDALGRRGFLEVETPILQTIQGGASARPFVTHSNALDIDFYLRIAPELFLKRCLVGGLERVFEINRNFRNEGIDATHSPEFTMLEAYEAYGTYDTMAELTRAVVQEVALGAFGSTELVLADGSTYDIGGNWAVLEMYPSLSEAVGVQVTPETEAAELRELAANAGLAPEKLGSSGAGKIVEELWEHLIGDHLRAPTFVRDFPSETSPLTRQHRSIAGVAEKWDLYVRGFELATGYSELVDPVVQRERFQAQALLRSSGDGEAMPLDEDFLAAMEHGMPPSGGIGLGVDRLLTAFTGLGIRDTVLFPVTRPNS